MAKAAVSVRTNRSRLIGARAVFALILREMTTTYGKSIGGYFWTVAEPVAAIALLSVVFSMIVHKPPLGQSFILFYASGYLTLTAYNAISINVAMSIRFSKALLAYPSVTYIDAIAARLILTTLTQLQVFAIVIAVAIATQHSQINLNFPALGRAWGMLIALGTAVGLLNCYLMSTFPAWQMVWAVLNRPMFLVTGVLFLIDQMPEPVRIISLLVPPTHVVMMMRKGIYDTYDAVYVSEAYVYGVSLLIGALGMLLLHRHHRTILSER
ncbi:ABC transporter permease [Rhodobacter capsulatus]|uniref:ABC transporter permease n=1 Tax=Rhodobacter capsulatus TaxID=1061 RepID=UPI0003D34DBD|nr:ABC transporter permease [Rhodobacter capsulatus]ETD85879.1 sugar ABC transporter permease [Rhodobacter capsulatus B6]